MKAIILALAITCIRPLLMLIGIAVTRLRQRLG